MVALENSHDSSTDLNRLANALESVRVGHALDHLASERDELIQTIRGYLMPRATDKQMPLVVVFAGPTGSGKSTLVNSLAGRTLTETGPVRPTTRGPIALVGRRHLGRNIANIEMVEVTGGAPILDTMTLIDTPDIDSTEVAHRKIAEHLIDHADVVVFVTSALRYADEAPWQVLRRAVSRGATVINVINRVTAETGGAIVDFRARLASEGLQDGLVSVSEHHIDADQQRVPSLAVRSLSRRLVEAGVGRGRTGEMVVERVLTNVNQRVALLADELDDAVDRLSSLEAEIDLALGARTGRISWPTDVAVTFPKDGRRRSVRRWKKRSESAVTDSHADWLIAAVQSDLLGWALDQRVPELTAALIGQAVQESMPVVAVAIAGWRRAIPEIVSTNPFEDWSHASRSDLVERVEVAYGHVSERLIEMAGDQLGSVGGIALRQALAARIDA